LKRSNAILESPIRAYPDIRVVHVRTTLSEISSNNFYA